MRQLLTYIFLFFCLQLTAQTDKEKLVGDWKLYLKDKINFEFLRLNSNGTGLKCFGQTINGKDTFFLNQVTTLQITKWKVSKKKLILETDNTVTFKVNPEYKLTFLENDKIELDGEHLIYHLYPSILNRKEFQRTVTYQKADKIPKDFGVISKPCIVKDRKLFKLSQIDSATQLAEYKGFDDLIPYIVNCNNGYEFAQKYNDPPYSIEIPTSIQKWSFGFGNKEFYISFYFDENDTSKTSVVIRYDFGNELKDYFLNQLNTGKVSKNIVKLNGLTVYKTNYNQDYFEGRVFYDNNIVLMYYTKNEKAVDKLQKCVTSFKYSKVVE